MRRYKLLLAGLLMVGAGAFLIFNNPPALPLWFVWIAGPILWYIGIAVSIGGIGVALLLPFSKQEKQALAAKQKSSVPVLHMQKFVTQSPAGLVREIPAMGGFLM
jgi:glucose dehydrogenase